MDSTKDFTTEIRYVHKDPLFEREKPYSADFDPGDGKPQTNHVSSPTAMLIRHISPHESFDLNVHGFCVLKSSSTVSPEDILMRPREVEDICFKEAEALLQAHFPEYERIDAMSLTVSIPILAVSEYFLTFAIRRLLRSAREMFDFLLYKVAQLTS
ncbi:hypothetical protein CSIM01_02788 [Colletotrichum simmondsii]|uniref:Uncharacterized protein n=1 Tax=Colletotrichum simmondsii TaxID=703756 RepID=A0A135T1D8_9PEZI|nr:hypothetical protein CSIM01_02788 [Colletotrichum simmondsii]